MLYLFLKKAVVLTLPGIQILVSSSTSATYVLITDFITVAAAAMLLLLLPVLIPASVKGHRYCNYSNIKHRARAAVCDTQLRSIRCRVLSPARHMPELFFVTAGNASCVFFSRPLPECVT